MSTGSRQLETTRVRLTNTSDTELDLWLEPWGELYSIEPNSSVEVEFESEQPGIPEVDHEPDCMVIYGWSGSTARVLRNGVVLDDRPQS